MADPARLPAPLTRAAIEQIQKDAANAIAGFPCLIYASKPEIIHSLCVLALRGLERPTCATCRWFQPGDGSMRGVISDNDDRCGIDNIESPMYSQETNAEFGCPFHEPKPAEVIP